MAYAGDALINEVATRLRDRARTTALAATNNLVPPVNTVNNYAYPRATVLQVLNSVQAAINLRLGLIQLSTTFTTDAYALYSLSTISTNIGRVIAVRDANGRDLQRQPWANLIRSNDQWWRHFAPRAEQWAQIGRELLVITPTPLIPEVLTVVAVKITDAITDSGASFMELPDEYKPVLLDLTEAVLLLRARDWGPLNTALERAATRLGFEDLISNMRSGTSTPEPSSGGS